jgi:hypothetical protein
VRHSQEQPPDARNRTDVQSDATTDQSNRGANQPSKSTVKNGERKPMKKKAAPTHPDDQRAIDASREAMIVAAIEYAKIGLSVFPTGIDKRPALSAAALAPTRERPTPPDQIRSLFRGTSWTGIGIYLGAASGGVYARDFDDPDAYHEWTRLHPDLAATLPTAKTASRGFHVYARWDSVKTSVGGDGELRSTGNYVVAPPSWARSKEHLRASQYEWFKPFDAVIARVDPVEGGLLAKPKNKITASNRSKDIEDSKLWDNSQDSKRSEDSDNSDRSDDSQHSDSSHNSQNSNHSHSKRLGFACEPWTLEYAIERTVVTPTHKRDSGLLAFARALLRVEGADQWSNAQLHKAFRTWWDCGVVHMTDKDFDSNFGNFLRAFRTAFLPLDVKPLALAAARASEAPVPTWAMCFENPDCRRLAGLVRELARISNPFFLSQYDGAESLGWGRENTATIWKWLQSFCAVGATQLTQKGGPGRANRYIYLETDL